MKEDVPPTTGIGDTNLDLARSRGPVGLITGGVKYKEGSRHPPLSDFLAAKMG
jgi:hypothetical protein